MGTPLSAEAERVLKTMQPGEWRLQEEVIAALAPTVAPGRALRRYETDATPAQLRVFAELSDDEKIRSGQRRIARLVVRSLTRRFLEVEDRDGVVWLRKRAAPLPVKKSKVFRVPDAEPNDELRPCGVCGGLILTSQEESHADWHAMAAEAPNWPVGTPEPAQPFPEAQNAGGAGRGLHQLRLMVREEMAAAIGSDVMRQVVFQQVLFGLGGSALREVIRQEVTEILDRNLDEFEIGMRQFLQQVISGVEHRGVLGEVTRLKNLGGNR